MTVEYLLFDLLVLGVPAALSVLPGPTFFAHRWTRALTAVLVASWPWLGWDAAVAGRHWWFEPTRILGPRFAGLPLEEIGFFVAVPLACLYTWEILLRGPADPPRPLLQAVPWAAIAMIPAGAAVLLAGGPEYTGLAVISAGTFPALDLIAGTRVLQRPRGLVFVAVVLGLTLVFNNYLTGRPIVLYDPAYQLDLRLFTMPIEDLGFGLGLVGATTVAYEKLGWLQARDPSFGLVARLIRARFGGYRHAVVTPDPALPDTLATPRRVLVIGGGLSGIGAADALAKRGFDVVIREKNPYLGGKIGAWTTTLHSGEVVPVEHGFHAFFRQYHNQRAFLDEVGVTATMQPIADYLIRTRDGEAIGFAEASSVPLLNLLSLARLGVYSLLGVATSRTGEQLETLLRYDREATFAQWDDTSYAEFAESAALPRKLRLVFTTFSRAFFAEGRHMSMAELIKSFHFFYLSNDSGLIYDHPTDDYEQSMIGPLREHLAARGVTIRLDSPVHTVSRAAGGGLTVDGEDFDHVVLAADVRGTRAALEANPELLAEAPALAAALEHLKAGQRYSVLRLWLDRDVEVDWPVFVSTERGRVLDSITLVHRASATVGRWAAAHRAGVYELHCYAVPDDLEDDAVRDAFLAELWDHLPELRGAEVLGEDLQIRDDFPAFHVGAWRSRPETASGIGRLWFAGDWVKLPWPAMLMEAAQVSALCAANAICDEEGVRALPIWSVPERGFLAGLPELPKRPTPTRTEPVR